MLIEICSTEIILYMKAIVALMNITWAVVIIRPEKNSSLYLEVFITAKIALIYTSLTAVHIWFSYMGFHRHLKLSSLNK